MTLSETRVVGGREQRTHFPLLQLYNLNVSSSAAVKTNSPLSSKLRPVMCLGPCIGPREATSEDEEGSGPGSTEPLKTFAGFSLVYPVSTSVKMRPVVSQKVWSPYHESVRKRERGWRLICGRHRSW